MAKKNKDTKQRLLEAACEIFADKGYSNTTVADVCDAADANIALVNYYFGDKESLYNCAWRYAFDTARTEFPLGGDVAVDAKPEERLQSAIRAILGRIYSEDLAGYFARMMLQEMASPTVALSKIVKEATKPQMDYVKAIVEDLLGEHADQTEVMNCLKSTMSQCFMLSCSAKMKDYVFEGDAGTRPDKDLLAIHITNFSLAGIRAVRKKLEDK